MRLLLKSRYLEHLLQSVIGVDRKMELITLEFGIDKFGVDLVLTKWNWVELTKLNWPHVWLALQKFVIITIIITTYFLVWLLSNGCFLNLKL